jgi:hypothetical protein
MAYNYNYYEKKRQAKAGEASENYGKTGSL